MKAILYVLVNRAGNVKTFTIGTAQQNGSDAVNLELFRPDNLMGKAKKEFDDLIRLKYSLSNWHVIEF